MTQILRWLHDVVIGNGANRSGNGGLRSELRPQEARRSPGALLRVGVRAKWLIDNG
ncbi:MAG: hypothetical protein ACQESM_08725 [Bacteroidota bacterium]